MAMTTKRRDAILACLRHQDGVRREDIGRYLEQMGSACSKTTLVRELHALSGLGLVERSGTGRGVRYALSRNSAQTMPVDVAAYFSKDADERSVRSEYFNFGLFDVSIHSRPVRRLTPQPTDRGRADRPSLKGGVTEKDFIGSAVLSTTLFPLKGEVSNHKGIFDELQHLLTQDEIAGLDALNAVFRQKKAALSPGLLRKEYERLTVELAWKSSRIEGNTYTLLDTERLLRDNVTAAGKTVEESRMLLNHKQALEYVLSAPEYYRDITVRKMEEIHSLLTEGLHVAPGIRSGMVGIVGTNYRPLDNKFQIRDALEKLSDMINRTRHAVEKALLAILMISYIQPFEDGNKRTSRILGNALLVAGGYCPLSYRSVDEVEYKKAMIIFYEQNNVSYFKQLFLEQFRAAVKDYF